jgi:cyanophycinase-like exopeptidase
VTLVSARASAQITQSPEPVSAARLISVNMLLGAATAGVWSAAGHRSFWRGFARGAAAGAAVYAGKELIAEGNPSSWWAGRQLAALGSSEVVNASQGLGFLQRVVIPVGPVRIHVDRRAKRKISPRLDLGSSVSAIVIASRERTHFALNESLATGVLVFTVPETSQTVGAHTAGVVSISELLPDGNFPPLSGKRSVISHEMIHAAQADFAFIAWSDGIQRAIAKRIPGGGFVSRYVDVNLTLPFQLAANALIDYESRPWEKEAVSFANRDK